MPNGDIVGNMEDGVIGINVNIYTIGDIWLKYYTLSIHALFEWTMLV